jgi:membrane protease subunit (stomatin/prohibitin family)
LGGNETADILDWDAEWARTGPRGSAQDALAMAVDEIRPHFNQCPRCEQWVCGQICWNGERGTCVTCAPKLDREVVGMQAAAQIERLTAKLQQLNAKIEQQDWTGATARCPACHGESGGGKFCQLCGASLASAATGPGPDRHCANCGTAVGNAKFCGECGAIAG